MEAEKKSREKLIKYGLPFLCTAALALTLALRYNFHFSSNDDSFLKALLSGAFSGVPEPRDVYHLYPLSFALSLLYRICPLLPWYGLFLCAAQFGALYLCLVRCMSLEKGIKKRAFICAIAASLFTSLMLKELVMIQYTVVSAMLATTSVFLLITDEREEKTTGQFLLHRLPCIALYAAAFMLRKEMGLFLLPFMFVGCGYKWLWDDDQTEDRRRSLPGCIVLAALLLLATVTHIDFFFVLACLEIARGTVWCVLRKSRGKGYLLLRYAIFLLCLTGTIGALYAADAAAYRSDEWSEARAFDNSRISIYDFGKIPPYAESRDLYEGLGISEEEQMLLENYNFALSDHYDSRSLGAIEKYQARYFSYLYTVEYIKKVILDVVKKVTEEPDMPYGMMLIAAYVAAVFSFIFSRKYSGVYLLTYVLMAHMICWGYLTWKNRIPARVTHGLYLTEIVLIAAISLRQYRIWKNGIRDKSMPPTGKKRYGSLSWILLGSLGIYCFYSSLTQLATELPAVREAEQNWETVRTYCEANPENLYLLDTLSASFHMEKVFDKEPEFQNYTLCGGWSVNMPAWDRKLAVLGVPESLYRSIQEGKEMYFIIEAGRDIEWMENFFEAENLKVRVQLTDILTAAEGMKYEVYLIK